jgi:hypothetical protein
MKRFSLKGLSFLGLLNLALISNSYADIVVHAPFSGKEDLCTQIAGNWAGHGKAVELSIVTCDYKGTVTIKSPSPGNINLDDMTLTLNPDQSSYACRFKPVIKLNLKGECHNGKLIIHDKETQTNLDGDLSEDGKEAKVSGTVTVSFPWPIGKITPNVDVDIKKVS